MIESISCKHHEYVSVEALDRALKKLMERKGVSNWMQTAFDAADIDWLIHETPQEHTIVVDADGNLISPDKEACS